MPLSRAVAVRALADLHAVNLKPMGVRVVEGFARLTEGVPCYQLVHKDADELLQGLVAALAMGAEAASGPAD